MRFILLGGAAVLLPVVVFALLWIGRIVSLGGLLTAMDDSTNGSVHMR